MKNNLYPLSMFKSDLDKCMKCGFCRELCPASSFYSWEANSPRGKIQLLKALMEGELSSISNYLIERLYFCMECAYCFYKCPAGVKTYEVFEAAKAMLAAQGRVKHEKIIENILKFQNPFGKPQNDRGKWLPSEIELSDKPEILYWVGCVNSYRLKEAAIAMAQILNASKENFTILGNEEGECGSILIRMGYWSEAKKIAEENKAKIENIGVKTLVTSCPSCLKAFINDYPKLFGINLKLEILHSSQLLENLINAGKLKPSRLNLKVAYHDPCYLGRHLGIYNSPRKVINAIPGIELKEPSKSKGLSFCCGAGGAGSFKYIHEDLAIEQAAKRINQFKEAEAIATACPFCVINLREGAEKLGKSIPIYELSALLKEALKLR
ncbi:(Fe-S)-binding protein [Candidatus Bathyarchaeota archaeon]|nr:(Fe-S)-binding protein [Candidatus Bathyarchaeota archaeon]